VEEWKSGERTDEIRRGRMVRRWKGKNSKKKTRKEEMGVGGGEL